MSTSDGIPDTGYDKKLNVNYSILKEILRESNFDEFLRACPRYPDFVTELDVTKLLYFKGIAESWSDEEIELPSNLMDIRQFNDCSGKISGSIVKEIKKGDPRNLEYETVQESMLDMNDLTANVTEKVVVSEAFMKMVRESLLTKVDRRGAEEGISKDELAASINQLDERLGKLEKREPSVLPSDKKDTEKGEGESLKEIRKLNATVIRSWSVRANDADESLIINEKRGKEEGGDLSVEISDGQGSMVWSVNSTKLGQSLLYERIKKIFVELLDEGKVTTDLRYSFPNEGEKRNFSPQIKGDKVWFTDSWIHRKALFNKEYEQKLTFTVGESSWSIDIRMENSKAQTFKGLLEKIMAMVLLSGEEVTDDSRPYK